jgi:SAM domain (Sterile alpha motif)
MPRATTGCYRRAPPRSAILRAANFEVRCAWVVSPLGRVCRLLTPTLKELFTTTVVVLCGTFLLYDSLAVERAKAFATKDDLKAFATKDDLKALATKEDLKAFATKEDLKAFATKEDIKEVLLAIAGVPRAVRSLSTGLKQLEKGEPLSALATASPAEVERLLEKWGFSQYSHRLAPLGGAGLLMLTESSLAAMDVAPEHRALLLEKVYGCDG